MKELSIKECQKIAGGYGLFIGPVGWAGQILRGVITIVLANIINKKTDTDKDKDR